MTVYLSRIASSTLRSATARCINAGIVIESFALKNPVLSSKSSFFSKTNNVDARKYSSDAIVPTAVLDHTGMPLKLKITHKKASAADLSNKEGHYLTLAYATAHAYDLKSLKEALVQQKLYEPGYLKSHEIGGDVVVASAVYSVGSEPREILFFREGSVVFWNCTELEANNVLEFIRPFEIESYPKDVVEKEKEIMTYNYQPNARAYPSSQDPARATCSRSVHRQEDPSNKKTSFWRVHQRSSMRKFHVDAMIIAKLLGSDPLTFVYVK